MYFKLAKVPQPTYIPFLFEDFPIIALRGITVG